jgi:hypothetical protein
MMQGAFTSMFVLRKIHCVPFTAHPEIALKMAESILASQLPKF